MSPGPAEALLVELAARGLTVATAESLTGGLVAAAITDVPGASLHFRGGVVAYATDVKTSLLGVPSQVLRAHGPVSSQTAAAMASAAASVLGADLGLATTGVAGPDPVGEHLPGTVFIAVAGGDHGTQVRRLTLSGGRPQVRAACVSAVLRLGVEVLSASTRE